MNELKLFSAKLYFILKKMEDSNYERNANADRVRYGTYLKTTNNPLPEIIEHNHFFCIDGGKTK